MNPAITIRCNAKINIGLHIVGKRPDGYHLLETLFFPIYEFADMLTIWPTEGEECTIEMTGITEEVPLEQNLCFKAWRLMQAKLGKTEAGVKMRVEKTIPAGAGLGGGSSDAAGVMKVLRDLWQADVSDATLAEWGATLGADVPFFIYNKPMYGTGTGTDLVPFDIDLSRYDVSLTLVRAHSSTVEAYRALRAETIVHAKPLSALLKAPIVAWRNLIFNDLEKPVFEKLPVVAAAKQSLYDQGALYAAMSGSGSACFGIFAREGV
jgi:4-diphosphocytidyl-2-C-methyl-D-erythritol kinase